MRLNKFKKYSFSSEFFKCIPFIIILVLCIGCKTKKNDSVIIKGEIIGLKDSWVKLRKIDFAPLEFEILDSFFVENESFEFLLPNVLGGICIDFYLEALDRPTRFIFIEDGERVRIKGSTKNRNPEDKIDLEVSGAKSHDKLLVKEKEIDSIGVSKMLFEGYVQKDTASLLSPVFILFSEGGEKYFNNLTPKVKESYYGQKVANKIEKKERTKPGNLAPSINCEDHLGTKFSLHESQSKYTILDFWASWCGPCRKSHPELISLHRKYNQQGLRIVSISLDKPEKVQDWKEAIQNDKIDLWTQIILHNCQETNIKDKYYVELIPMKYVIDNNGYIIKKFIGSDSDEVMDFVEQLFVNNEI